MLFGVQYEICHYKFATRRCLSNAYRAYSRPLLGATIAPNLVPWVLKKIFSFEMVKNDIHLDGASKQNALISKNMP